MNLDHLKAEFPRARVHWRAQTIRNGRALALAYIDARDVMGRLDEVCGPHNWQDEYVIHGDRTICRLGIKIGDEWVWKSDGAGETQVEAEKGAISDAFKRAAVKWGIGRYLYGIEAPWVPCESRTDPKNANRQIFIKFNVNPWELIGIKEEPVVGKLGKKALQDKMREFDDELHVIEDSGQLAGLEDAYKEPLAQCERDLPSWYYGKAGSDSLGIKDRIAAKRKELEAAEREAPQEPRGLPESDEPAWWPFVSSACELMDKSEDLAAVQAFWKQNGKHIASLPDEALQKLLTAKEKAKERLGDGRA